MTSVRILIAAAVFFLTAQAAQALQLAKVHVPAGVEARAAGFARYASPKVRAFVAKEGAVQAQVNSPSVAAVKTAIPGAGFSKLSEADIDALCFLVLAQAADDQARDLENVMAAVKASRGKGDPPKPHIAAQFTLTSLSPGQLQAALDRIKADIDSQSGLGEMASLRLQMAMDRESKFLDALSNIMKDIDNTSEAIVQNIK
jgi:hypothetical protein